MSQKGLNPYLIVFDAGPIFRDLDVLKRWSATVPAGGRNAVFYGNKAIDRSPCGTGTSARLAQLFAKGKLKVGEKFIHESFIGSTFIGCVEKETMIGGKLAIIPSIQGWAKIYGYNTITIDSQDDPYAFGFSVI
ncbi:MAG: proline racemase family protein, partial [Polaribacter sp.]|nr:proline racemase family protein [Polaribacter sp.]